MKVTEQNEHISEGFDEVVDKIVQKFKCIWAIISAKSFIVVTDSKVRSGVQPKHVKQVLQAMDHIKEPLTRLAREADLRENN
jgi:hypothetical protein